MIAAELLAFCQAVTDRHASVSTIVAGFDPAAVDTLSTEDQQDAYAEAIFIRAFTAYENDLETLFLHYVTGGQTKQGAQAQSYLNVTDASQARKLTKAGFKFLSWAKPSETRTTTQTYMRDGWPIGAHPVLTGQSA